MSVIEIVNTLLLKPIELFFEIIFMVVYDVTGNPGISIVILSLIMNFLLLPLYNRADKIQEEERDIENKLHDGVAHIKKTFRGDERMMVLQTYYRQNHYKPTYVLRGAVSLLLEIPFFMAAYAFLSKLELLEGVSFGSIGNLGQPDALFVIAGISINVLPILMTLINIIASVLYTKGAPVKEKVQLYIMALIFLVVLYDSPSGLVFYWTMNNVFSLVKTMIQKTKYPGKVLCGLAFATGILIEIIGIFIYPSSIMKVKVFICFLGILLQLPLLYLHIKKRFTISVSIHETKPNKKIFLLSGVFMALLTGLLIPSAVLSASPQEFVDIHYFYHPLWYLCSAFCLAVGMFVIWASMFYALAKNKGKNFLEFGMVVFSCFALIDYMFFGKKMGILSATLKYEDGLTVDVKEMMINGLVLLGVLGAVCYIIMHWKKQLKQFIFIASIVLVCMSIINIRDIYRSVNIIFEQQSETVDENICFNLSKKGKNVVVIMLDRAFGGYVPYLVNEKPELQEMFDGFTYYSNVISYGGHSNFGVPVLYGGYEYTPLEMNKRKEKPLVEKHNEALKLMPTIFSQNDFEVTIADPPYVNYQEIPDLSVFSDIPNSKSYITMGKFNESSAKQQVILNNKRNFFCYGLMKALPLCLQDTLYEEGTYRQGNYMGKGYVDQICENVYVAQGIEEKFMSSYNVLKKLPEITNILEDQTGQFIIMDNNTTHDPMMLQEPEYIPAKYVDNTEYERQNRQRFELNGKKINMENITQMMHYQANMAAFLQLGKWFEYLRDNECYDNTRIILVADHGYDFKHFDDLIIDGIGDVEYFYPLLMMKDFNSSGFKTSDEFMTQGDVPTMATKDIVENPINPFTGKKIDSQYKEKPKQYIIGSHKFDPSVNNGNTFMPSVWYSVHDNIWDKNNWEVVEEEDILP